MKTLKLTGGMRVVDLQPKQPNPHANAWEGYHNPDGLGSFEVFWSTLGQLGSVNHPIEGDPIGDMEPSPAGWYWWSCSPGCLPDDEANGPYLTSQEAYEDAMAGES